MPHFARRNVIVRTRGMGDIGMVSWEITIHHRGKSIVLKIFGSGRSVKKKFKNSYKAIAIVLRVEIVRD